MLTAQARVPVLPDLTDYSARRASTGSTLAARLAGMKLAASAATAKIAATANSVGRSQERTPKSRFFINAEAANEQINPMAKPIAIRVADSFRIRR